MIESKEKQFMGSNVTSFKKFLKSEQGATAIEYALIATGISLAIVVVVFAFGEQIAELYNGLATLLTD